MIGDVLWTPSPAVREATEIGRFMRWLAERRGRDFQTYDDLWRWSVTDLEGFWGAIWEFYEIKAHTPYERVLARDTMPGAQWFPGATVNYAEHLVGAGEDRDKVAVLARSQTRPPIEMTFGELRERAARVRTGLQNLGVGPGDRVVAYLPNIPETLIAFIATASLGAVWATCAPEFGARSVVDRFSQIEPKLLLAVGGYGYRDRYVDRRAEVDAIRERIGSIERTVWVPYGDAEVADALPWSGLQADSGPLTFDPVPFDHPLYVLFSSGTTGLPKAIVHGHGGQLIEHHKNQGIGWDLKPGGRLQWFSTTAWMMWNALVSGLLLRSSIVMLDGDPGWPDLLEQWRIAEQLQPTVMGVSPPYLMACRKSGLHPGRDCDLRSIRALCTAGSPLPAEGYTYVYDELDPEVLLINGSGGTDVCTGIVSGSFAQPVFEGEISGRCLGVDAHALDPGGNEVIGELGELVIRRPMPSMPVGLWNDPNAARYRAAYFDRWPGTWRQGDWIMFTERGSCMITGRSDATLNRGGVRLGTGEFYAVVEEQPEIIDALVVHLEDPEGGLGELLLFVAPAPGVALDDELRARMARALRTELSPRHVPDAIVAVPAIPRTLTQKKLELPVKQILRGVRPERVASRDALADPTALDAFVAYAGSRVAARGRAHPAVLRGPERSSRRDRHEPSLHRSEVDMHDARTAESITAGPRTKPPFRADHVGSLLRPANLVEAREESAAGRLSADELRAVEDDAIREVVKMQLDVGLRSATDGEFRRTSWHMDFIYQLGGIDRAPGHIKVQFHNPDGDIEFTPAAIHVGEKVHLDQPIFGEHFRFLQGLVGAGVTPKLTIPSPSMVHYRGGRAAIDPAVYPDVEEFWSDLTSAYAAQVRAVFELGCRYLQFDDTSLAYLNDPRQREQMASQGEDAEHLHETYIRHINEALAGRPEGLTVTTHLCRGNFRSSWAAEGGYDFVAEALFGGLEVDGFFLEYDDARSGGFEPLRFVPKGKVVVLGLVTTKRGELERKDLLKRRIEEASKYVPIEQLCLSPQCGFSSTVEGNSLTYDEEVAKLRLIVETAAEVWG